MRELVKIVLVLAFLLSLCVGNLSAQYAKLVDSKKYSKTEMSLFNASVGYFESGDYTNAYMGFSQLHSWYASDPVFSYYCGASMVMLRTEYDKAIKYLTLAYDNKLYDADYYLGLAYHRKYLFSKSITFYSRYRDYLVQSTKGKSPKIAEVESLMEKANKARALGKESYVLKVISNNKVKRSNFHFSYGRKILDGNIVVKPDFFRQRNDKNNKDIDLVYVLDTIAFVSSYGSDMKTGLDLYVSHKTDEGWSPLHLLPGNINTDSDEAFPFLASDKTLYFASKGHNSIGGYDIFKSVYDSESGHWGEPENLGFPINTPYDDFMYAVESNGNSAFFASDRSSKDGQVMVCRYIVEETPEKLHIETEEHLAEQAELPITPGAEAEYNRIVQEQQSKANEVKDSTVENKEVKHEIDTTDLFATTKSMLEEKVSAISNYQDYSRKLNAYARITSNKIRAIRNGESDADMSPSDITKMANSVVTYYDLSQKFNSVYSTAKPTLDYCTKEMSFLDKLETGSGEYQFKLQNLNISVEKVNAKSPLEALIEEKKNERKQADDALKKLSRNMGKIQRSLSGINKDLEAKMLVIQNETDPVLREKYINEHKALENSKIDVISSKKNMDVEAKRLNAMMARADETIRMLEDIEDILANLDLSELDETEDIGANDILALQNFISDEDNKEIAEYEKEVENDESLYSEKIDYEAIAANNSSALTDIVNEVAEYKGDMSKSTSAVVGMIVQSDSLYSQKSRFEAQFDAAESDEEKKELLGKINATQKQIDERGKAIESGLVYEPNSSVSKAIDDFNSIKQEKVNSSDWPELVSSTQNLIEKSRKLESQISESKSEANAGVDKAKLLEKIMSDIDNQIVDNVEEMQGIVVAQQSGKKDIAAMNAEIARIRSAAKDKNAETEVKKDLNSASKKVVESKQGGSSSVTTLNDAEKILAGAVEKRIAILNEEYEAESQVYDVLAGKYVKSKSTESQKQQADVIYYSALEDRQQAESVTDEVEKMKYLSEANKKMKSANSALLQVVSSVSKPEMQQEDVLTQDILSLYDDIKEQKGASSPTEPVEANVSQTSSGQNVVVSSVDTVRPLSVVEVKDNDVTKVFHTSVTLQTTLANRIATNTSEISDIETSLVTASRTDRKHLQTELGEVTTERNGNVRSLGEEKQHFYSELDKAVNEEISKSAVSAEYANRYADYRQSLYSLTTAEKSDENISEKLTEAEKSEYALLQTIIPNVNAEMASVLSPIYNSLAAKYGISSPSEPVEANVTSGQNVVVSSVDTVRPLSVVEVKDNDVTKVFQTSVTLQTTLANRITTNTTEISDIETNLATASRTDRKRLQTELGEVTTERNGNVRSLGEEKQRFYSELDKSVNEEISKSAVSAEYANRYADYRQSLYSLTTTEPSDENIPEKLTEAEKSEYALLQTVIPNVNAETAAVLIDIYSILDDKYGSSELVEANLSESTSGRNIAMSDIAVSSVESSHPLNDPSSPAELVEANVSQIVSGQNVVVSSVDTVRPLSVVEVKDNYVTKVFQTSVTLQTTLANRIATNTTEISDIETSLATASRTDRKRLQTELGEVTTERNGNVRSLGEEKQRFYSELDKAVNEEISKSAVSAEYANRYADYRQSLYILTTAEPSDENISEKLTEAEKSEYALLQTIIPNVNAEMASVLSPIYNSLAAKYGISSPSEPVEASVSQSTSGQNVVVSSVDNTTSFEGTGNAQLQTSVTLQTTLANRIATNTSEINDIETNLSVASRTDRKRLQTELGEVTTERNGNVHSLGEEKQRFYSELDKAVNEEISKSAVSAEYANRYADYRQSLYSLTTAEKSDENIDEKLTEAEKSEYALLQTIIPNVNSETASVLSPIYNSLAYKYGASSPAEPVEANVTSGQNVVVSSVDTVRPLSVVEVKDNDVTKVFQTSVTRQTTLANRIATNTSEINDIETNLAVASRTDRKRLQTELGEVTTERNGNVRSLGEEKQRFYSELDKAVSEEISKSAVSAEYANRYADYRQSLYSLTTAEPSDENITEKLTEAEKSEYALLQTIIPNVNDATAAVLIDIYSILDDKYGTSSPAELVEASVSQTSSGQNVTESSVNNTNATEMSGKAQLQTSVTLQTTLANRITTNTTEISDIETNLATASRTDRKRLQTELGEVTTERNGNVRSLGEEKQRFYSELDKAVNEEISKTAVSAEYANRYADYRQSLYSLTTSEPSDDNIPEKLTEAEKSEYALLQTIIPNVNDGTAAVLSPIYNSLAAKYGTSSPAELVEASVSQTTSGQNVAVSTILPESYSQSMNFQEQMIRNIDISTREIERLEQRKDGARKSEQRRISDDIAREESQKLDDIQKLAVEKSRFYSDINQSLENALPKLSDSVRNEYVSAYEAYNETLTTMKIGLGFYDMQKANKIYENSEIKEYKLLQQMKQVTAGEVRNVVDNMILRMESKNSNLRKYRVVVSYTIEDVAENNTSTSNVSGKSDNRIISANGSDAVNNIQVEVAENNTSTGGNVSGKSDNVSISTSVSNTTDVAIANVDSLQDKSKRKSMSGYNTDSYGIYEMPEINMGLYYRIQIVAVSLKYRMRDFKGLSLIFTEQIPNTNIIRYMTGEYYRYVSAHEDLPKVRGLGFSDAFIVAYYNGKRISIGEARRLEALQNAGENEEIPVVIRHEAPAGYVEPEDIIASSQTKSETIANTENNVIVENGIVNGQNVLVNSGVTNSSNGTAIEANGIPAKGVYFTVQVGVYKDRRRSSQLKGVSPVAYETMPNGFVRHISGLFTDYSQARTSQMDIRRQGITDAFVIAYIDGRKVSFSEGVEYQKSMANRTIAEANVENTTSKSQTSVSSEENLSNVEYAPLNLNTGTEENNKDGISYYVQIGAFSKSPDPEILSVFSKVAGDKIHVKFPREGLQIYRIGVFNSYEEAQNTLAEARSFGIVDAFIVAFKGDEQISSSEAIRLQNTVRQIESNSGDTIRNNAVQKSSSQTIQPTSNVEPKPVVPKETLQQTQGGVEYFVQLGAFVNTPDARSMATFRSIATNNGSRLSTVKNGRFTNYRVGAFSKFNDAKLAVDNARSMGVTDAFIVSFYNGERIPVVEAKEKEAK